MNGDLNNKKQPRRAISNHVPILVVPDTPPSGDSSEYRSLWTYAIIDKKKMQCHYPHLIK